MVVPVLVVAIAVVNLVPNLGSSSLFVDEGISWQAASAPTPADVVGRVRGLELTPPLHYLGLHEIMDRISDSEIAMRLPSALAGIALVMAILWVGTLAAGRQAGILAAGLAALSPLVLEYGQQARAYAFAMLAATLAAGALLKAERAPIDGHARRGWLAVFAIASVVGFWTHYTVALVCVPLLASSAVRRALSSGEAIGVSAAVGGGWALAAPIMLDQLGKGRSAGLAHIAFLSLGNFVELVGAPFDTRYGFFDLTVPAAAGAVVVGGSALFVLTTPPRRWPLVRSLILPAAFFPVIAVLLVTVVGEDVLLTRYVAVAVPFMLVLVGTVPLVAGRRTATAVLAVAGLSALGGSLLGHMQGGRYADWRAATREISKRDRPGDGVFLNHEAIRGTFSYYARRRRLSDLPAYGPPDPRVAGLVSQRRRLWVTDTFPPKQAVVKAALAQLGYRAGRTWDFEGSEPLRMILAYPQRARGTATAPGPPLSPGPTVRGRSRGAGRAP